VMIDTTHPKTKPLDTAGAVFVGLAHVPERSFPIGWAPHVLLIIVYKVGGSAGVACLAAGTRAHHFNWVHGVDACVIPPLKIQRVQLGIPHINPDILSCMGPPGVATLLLGWHINSEWHPIMPYTAST
jgi:hypothetical protein